MASYKKGKCGAIRLSISRFWNTCTQINILHTRIGMGYNPLKDMPIQGDECCLLLST